MDELQVKAQAGCGAHAFNSRTQEAEAEGSLGLQGQPSLHKEFEVSQGSIMSPRLEKENGAGRGGAHL